MTEDRGQVGLDCLLAKPESLERGLELQAPSALGGAEAEVEELDECVELVEDQCLVEGRERDGLGEAGAGFDEDKFGPQGRPVES